MPVDIHIGDDATRYLVSPARTALQVAVEQYSVDLLHEASRLEAAQNSGTADPEITSTMVQDAALLLRRGYSKPKKTRSFMTAQLLAPLGGVGVGFFSDAEKLKSPLMLLGFIVLLSLTITATVIVVVKD